MLRKLTSDERTALWSRVQPGARYSEGPWSRTEISMLRNGVIMHQLSSQALWSWCQTHEVKRHPDDIEAKLHEVNHFVPLTQYERASTALREEIAAAKAEAPDAPLFRQPVKEIEAFIHGVPVKTRAGGHIPLTIPR